MGDVSMTITPWYKTTSGRGRSCHITGSLWGESIGRRGMVLAMASGAEFWCFVCWKPEKLYNKQSLCHWFDTPWRPCGIPEIPLPDYCPCYYSHVFSWRHQHTRVYLWSDVNQRALTLAAYGIVIDNWSRRRYLDWNKLPYLTFNLRIST